MAQETQKINKIIIDMDGKEYEFDGGGGGQPGPHSVGHDELKGDSVGTDNIIDGAVQMEDLHDDVKGKIQKTYDESDETLHMDFDVQNQQSGATQSGQSGAPAMVDEDEEE